MTDCGIAERIDRSMKQNRKPRNRPIYIQSTDFWQWMKDNLQQMVLEQVDIHMQKKKKKKRKKERK